MKVKNDLIFRLMHDFQFVMQVLRL